MPVVNNSEMGEARFAALVDAYGANPVRWPASERAAAERWINSSPVAQAAAAKARRLDEVLSATDVPTAPPALQNKLLADFMRISQRPSLPRTIRAAANIVWPGVPVWQPAFAFGLALAIGIGIAVLMPLDELQADDLASSVFALGGAPDIGPGQDT